MPEIEPPQLDYGFNLMFQPMFLKSAAQFTDNIRANLSVNKLWMYVQMMQEKLAFPFQRMVPPIQYSFKSFKNKFLKFQNKL